MTTALFSCLYRPFEPWKHTEQNFRIAREMGFETVVAWDHRNSRSDYERILTLADTVVPFHSEGHCEDGFVIIPRIKSDFALLMADDETASPNLWAFAANPPMPARYCVVVIPVLGMRCHKKHLGSQERLIWVEGWRWKKRLDHNGKWTTFESTASSPVQFVILDDNMGCCIFHHLLEAPRAEREEKVARYTRIDPYGDHASRVFYEEQGEDAFVPLPPVFIRQLEMMNATSGTPA